MFAISEWQCLSVTFITNADTKLIVNKTPLTLFSWVYAIAGLTETELLMLLWPLAGDCLDVEGESLWNKI